MHAAVLVRVFACRLRVRNVISTRGGWKSGVRQSAQSTHEHAGWMHPAWEQQWYGLPTL